MPEVTKFHCPNCQAEYKVVRVEVPPARNEQLLCLSCGGPLHNREGKFALKYFRVDDGRALHHLKRPRAPRKEDQITRGRPSRENVRETFPKSDSGSGASHLRYHRLLRRSERSACRRRPVLFS